MTPIIILLTATVLFLLWYAGRRFFDWLECPDSVERAVRQRKKQAFRRDLYTKAKDVAFICGQLSSKGVHIHKDSVLDIRLDTTSEHGSWPVIVTFREAVVFEARASDLRDITAYLPGEWEQHLNRIHARAKDIQLKKNADHSARERETTIRNFGL